MLRPFTQTLKHIVLDIGLCELEDVDFDPLYGIPSQLLDLCTDNIIETIDIQIQIPGDGKFRRGDDWRTLDEVLTTPGWFFFLEEVKLVLSASLYDRPSLHGLQVELQNLPETHFPRLSSSQTIIFNFCVSALSGQSTW